MLSQWVAVGGGAIAIQGFEVGAVVAARVGGIEGATHSAEVCSIDWVECTQCKKWRVWGSQAHIPDGATDMPILDLCVFPFLILLRFDNRREQLANLAEHTLNVTKGETFVFDVTNEFVFHNPAKTIVSIFSVIEGQDSSCPELKGNATLIAV